MLIFLKLYFLSKMLLIFFKLYLSKVTKIGQVFA